ncbi:MAG: ABC transporter ATP-binding protein [Nanoarchaeota archaeon]|nr:ABC transporter ATP-binding protein [Nanoarchaeota archaeon]
MGNVIELKNVGKTYTIGEVKLDVLKGISLSLKKGEDLAIIGASGSGKTTMLNMIGILDTPTIGHVLIDGKDVSKMNTSEQAEVRRNKIGFVFQFFYLLPNLTALENVELPMMFNKKRNVGRGEELLKQVGLEKRMHHYPGQLSGGERQRVAIARALINEPEIILADEPTGNLDSKSGKQIMDILYGLNKKKISLIVITHDTSIAKNIKRKIYLKDGQIIKGR